MYVVKRDGKKIEFNRNKILNSIIRVNMTVEEKNRISEFFANFIVDGIENTSKTNIRVEEIQEKVENALMEMGYFDLARNHIKRRCLPYWITNNGDNV